MNHGCVKGAKLLVVVRCLISFAIGVLLLVLVGKSLVAMCIVLSLGYPMGTALTVSAALAQIGEFSFILAGIGVGLGLLPQDGFSMILAAALLSITLNPLVFAAVEPLGEWVRKRPRWREALEEARMPRFARLEAELAQARKEAEQRAEEHHALSPQQLLERFPLFSGLTHEQLEVVGLHFHPREAQPGERVIRTGDTADAAYFISSGQVEVAVAGKKKITLGPGDFFGEMALLDDQPRTADVEPRLLLAHLLRQGFRLTGTHTGCDTTNCGACTVLVDGDPVKSCTIMPVARSSKPSSLIIGKPQPLFCTDGCGHSTCSAGVSGAVTVVASAISTRRPSHADGLSRSVAAASCVYLIQSRHNCSITDTNMTSGSRARASQ